MERSRLVVSFDGVGQKVLGVEGVVALGETFDVLFRGVSFSGVVRIGMWSQSGVLVWDTEGSCEETSDGAVLRGQVVATQEAQDLFVGGGPFRVLGFTLVEVIGDERRDYGFARIRLYAGGDTETKYPPKPITDYWTAEETLEAIAGAIAGAVLKAGCNQLTAPVRLIRKDGSANPVLLIGSQVSGEGMKEDRWTLALHYDRLVLKTTPGGETHTLLFNRPGEDKANSDAIVLWKEMVAALADATEGLIGADGGTVGGVLRMKNPKVAADDDTAHDIALVPNAQGQGLQVQFPGGATAMVRAKSGTLATVADVDGKIASHDASEDAHADIREKLADKAEISELVTETEAREQGDAETLASAKEYADQRVTGVYRYKGSVATEADLPKTGNVTGDVWNVTEDGQNWAWDGEKWDSLRGIVDLSAYETEEEAEAKYLRKDVGGTVVGNVSFTGGGNFIRYLRFGGSAANAGLRTRGICGDTGSGTKAGLHLNYDGRQVPTEEYFSDGEGRGVYVCGQNSAGKEALVLRKMDGDAFYATKVDTEDRLAALEEQVGDLLSKAIAFTSGSATPGEAEIGASVASVVLKWSTNKTPTTLTLDGTALGTTETTRTMTGPFTTNKTWALKATDERGATATRNLSLTFKNKVYWGVGTATGTAIDDAFVLGLSGSAFATGRGRTFSANAGAGQYIYYVFPKSWGTPVFKVGGFEGGFALDREWEHTNASGGKVQYQAWRSTNAGLGATTVVVS